MTILVVGATGTLGRDVVRRLRARDLPVRAMVRVPARAGDLAALGAELIAGDLVDAGSVSRACAGATRVLAAAHGLLGRGRQASPHVDDRGHRLLIAAARAAGVQRFVYLSAFGASPDHPVDFWRTKHAVEQALQASGLDAVVLRPTAFMEQHVHLFNGRSVLENGKARLVGAGTKPRNFVSAADVAAFAERALLEDPPRFRVLEIGGPGHYSNAEVAAMYARQAGLPLRTSHLPAGVAAGLSALVRPLHPGVARVLRLASLPDDAMPERFDGAAALEERYGVRLTTVPDFVADRVREFRASRRS